MSNVDVSKTGCLELAANEAGQIGIVHSGKYKGSSSSLPSYIAPGTRSCSPALKKCQHYIRWASIFASCCQRYFDCRLCHDEHVDGAHADLEKHQVTKLKCLACGLEQPVSAMCTNPRCKKVFGDRFCLDCKLFDSTPGRDSYHCEQCGICRLGRREDNFHCVRCDTCIKLASRAQHVCTASPLRDAKCPICLSSMFFSSRPSFFLHCGHAMHAHCFDIYTQTHYRCPICFKSMANMHNYNMVMDDIMKLEHANMPPQYANRRVRIYCNDCGKKSQASFHFEHYKCTASEVADGNPIHCGSYNTRLVGDDN
jgi:hypothetical protein